MRVVFRDDASHVPAGDSTFGRQSWHRDDAATEPGLWFRTLVESAAGREAEALLGEEPAGRVAVVLEPDRARITAYEIVPALRGRRYGVQLLGQAVQFARAHGREVLALRCEAGLAGYFAQYGFISSGPDLVLDLRRRVGEIPEI